ncbi:transporter substrate-binding domain-containing protein [Shewanella salipaludis]|uniref:Amino acid ABC transporter substrate-binding protein n=1 Tax=Shewanella salipaludis TaxID=2723052 RepID=A0A972FWR7_9GAMM|nr:transporter substrate-binding domain-containing protein [Shewanella salipaludis]NMH67047.1 amino acid ABC transporter substrate-binding protein [Shewanella salipaludis]
MAKPQPQPAQQIRYFQTDLRYQYRIELLELALRKSQAAEIAAPETIDTETTATESAANGLPLQPLTTAVTQSRGIAMLEQGEVDVAFLPTSRELEQRLLAVRIPIMQGLLGYRVLLIHSRNQAKFAKLETLEQLQRRFVAGFGADWTDLAILTHNRLQVQRVTQYQNLFPMLNAGRFDYVPRGINEVWDEMAVMGPQYPGLLVDSQLALHYDYPIYFFVNKANRQLANRIEKGLRLALADGSFKRLFLSYHGQLVTRLRNRRVFELTNPTLPADMPAIDTSWWQPPAH